MEIKKSLSADLEGKKGTGLLIGFVLVLAAMFVAFEWTQHEKKAVESSEPVFSAAVEEDMIPITQQPEVVSPPPAAAPKVAEILNVVDNEKELNDDEVETSEEVNQAIVPTPGTGTTTVTAPAPTGRVVEDVDENQIYDVVEENPKFPGGEEACMKWLADNIKYPPICVEQGIQGRVYVQFVVNKDGSIVDIKIVRSPDPYLSKEAERVLKLMPKWSPGRQRGKPVRVKFSLPVMFRLQ
ncbi:MAG: energy transducer TonB [Paraprevotella sp.]|nr:energy transducer TonB [Paraprevotella sp.]